MKCKVSDCVFNGGNWCKSVPDFALLDTPGDHGGKVFECLTYTQDRRKERPRTVTNTDDRGDKRADS